ncbi:hypothetical protein [Pseudovibrio brasiliensis]|uniref:Uncharacterized protein n=1 Tax=Pseudovibrio brasiliensis TaxID=1898042 RepID=A0ABX8AVP9_9HYPH|nr:hypothetical protein [Pseudovibrio brasiliensis]QUS59129.1 hypothetical protein KGB56_26790 [Pseudovibrio brasiliensis]
MTKITTDGLDLAKLCLAHCADEAATPVVRKQPWLSQVLKVFSNLLSA